jgi:hypothetical protein
MMSAANKLYGIPHLLDLILSYLDRPDVLTLQRTSINLWQRASRVVYRAIHHHIYHRHIDYASVSSIEDTMLATTDSREKLSVGH